MSEDDARRARRHRRSARRSRARGKPVRALRDPRLPLRRHHPRPQRARHRPAGPAVGGDALRRRDRAHLPAVLPRPRVQPRAARAERPARRPGRRGRPRRERRARPPRRADRVRTVVRGARPGRVHLRLLERDRREGADRLPPPGRRRDRPRARDPPLRGHRDRRGAGIRGDGRRRRGGDRRRRHEGVRVRRRARSPPRAGSGPGSGGSSAGSSSSSSCSRCSAS